MLYLEQRKKVKISSFSAYCLEITVTITAIANASTFHPNKKRVPASHYIMREKKNLEFVSLPLKYNFPAKRSRPWPLPERSALLRFIRRQWHIFDGESRPSAAAGYRCPYGMRRGQPTVAAANPGHLLLDSFCISRVFYTLRELGVTFAFFIVRKRYLIAIE